MPRIQTPNSFHSAIRAMRIVCPSRESVNYEDNLPEDVSLVAEVGHNRHSQNETKKKQKSLRLEIDREEQAKSPNSDTSKSHAAAVDVIQQAQNDSVRIQQAANVENTHKPKLQQTRSSPGSVMSSSSRSNAVEFSSSLPRLHISKATSSASGQQRPKSPSGVGCQDTDHASELADSQVVVDSSTPYA